MKNYKIILGFLVSTLLIVSSFNAHAVKIFPRIGIEIAEMEAEDNLANTYDHPAGSTIGATVGFNGGLLFYMKENYIDLSFNLMPYDFGLSQPTDGNMPNDGIRSEVNISYGHRVIADTFIMAGYRGLGYSREIFGEDASQNGYFVGVNLTNMEWDDYLVSVSVAQVFGESVTPDNSSESSGSMIKVSWRAKDSHGLWHFKGEDFGPGIGSSVIAAGYTYLFY